MSFVVLIYSFSFGGFWILILCVCSVKENAAFIVKAPVQGGWVTSVLKPCTREPGPREVGWGKWEGGPRGRG